nr:iron-containing alcohol dehydrogenase [Streptomyces sp. SID8352]
MVDPVPMTRLGADLKDLVERQLAERFEVRRVLLDDGHPELHVSDAVLADAVRGVAAADAVVALGGGTISDLGKLAAFAGSGPAPVLVAVQTAASVDGYTDDVSVVLRDGVKRTVPSRWPDAVVADAETIAEAPARMNRAGFGEMTSMLTAPADWRLANLVGTDTTFHEGPIRLLEVVGADIDTWSPGVRGGDPDAVAALTRALALRGLATGIAGTTAVLSGVEHLVSHMLDQHHAGHHLPIGLHGAQVGAAAVVAAAAWELLLDRLATTAAPSFDEEVLDPGRARARVEHAFAGLGAGIATECWHDYERKLGAVTAARGRLAEALRAWNRHEPELRRLVRPSAEIAAALRAAGAPATPAELDPFVPRPLWRWAVAHCALMRNRFTVVDLLMFLGWWTDAEVDEVLARAEAAVRSADGPELVS